MTGYAGEFGIAIDLSTHILTRRMTSNLYAIDWEQYLSTHILTRRMTKVPFDSLFHRILSTHILTRRMTLSGYAGNLDLDLSTHILTRRMTSHPICTPDVPTFQLTSSQGGWPISWFLYHFLISFNSHPHKEDDHLQPSHFAALFHFQLTSSQGGWQCLLY